jgi:hypothetical protein
MFQKLEVEQEYLYDLDQRKRQNKSELAAESTAAAVQSCPLLPPGSPVVGY